MGFRRGLGERRRHAAALRVDAIRRDQTVGLDARADAGRPRQRSRRTLHRNFRHGEPARIRRAARRSGRCRRRTRLVARRTRRLLRRRLVPSGLDGGRRDDEGRRHCAPAGSPRRAGDQRLHRRLSTQQTLHHRRSERWRTVDAKPHVSGAARLVRSDRQSANPHRRKKGGHRPHSMHSPAASYFSRPGFHIGGGISHGLGFSDTLEWLYRLTGDATFSTGYL